MLYCTIQTGMVLQIIFSIMISYNTLLHSVQNDIKKGGDAPRATIRIKKKRWYFNDEGIQGAGPQILLGWSWSPKSPDHGDLPPPSPLRVVSPPLINIKKINR
jgi:hypothetical protein